MATVELATGKLIDGALLFRITDILIYLFTFATGTFNALMKLYKDPLHVVSDNDIMILRQIKALGPKNVIQPGFCAVLRALEHAGIKVSDDDLSDEWWRTLTTIIDIQSLCLEKNGKES